MSSLNAYSAHAYPIKESEHGLSKREYYAAQALASLIAGDKGSNTPMNMLAASAVAAADALIKALLVPHPTL